MTTLASDSWLQTATALMEKGIEGLIESCNSNRARELINKLPEDRRAAWNQKIDGAGKKLELASSSNTQANALLAAGDNRVFS